MLFVLQWFGHRPPVPVRAFVVSVVCERSVKGGVMCSCRRLCVECWVGDLS